MNELPNKRVFITGGASGISGATVRLLLQEGARVCSMSRSDAWPDDIRTALTSYPENTNA